MQRIQRPRPGVAGISRKTRFILIVLLPTLSAVLMHCQSWEKFWLDGSVTSFRFESNKTGLFQSYEGVISGDTITVTMPYGSTTSLAATFSANALKATVNNLEQVSGVTKNDFSSPVRYTFTSGAGLSRTYTVTINPTTPVTDSGQTGCFDSSSLQTCASTAALYPGQDADFLNIPAARGIQPMGTHSDYPVDFFNFDKTSGIAWKTCDDGQTTAACSGGANTYGQIAAGTTCASLNNLNSGAGYAGRKDWRLPAIQELMQLQQFETITPIDNTLFPNAAAATRWSSGTILPAGTNGILVNGGISQTTIGSAGRVRCVAGAIYPSKSQVNNGDGTIFDQRTGLTWQRCANGQTNDASCTGSPTGVNWPAALTYCKNLTLAGKSWRLPGIVEYSSLIDLSITAAPYVNTALFANFPLSRTAAPPGPPPVYYFWSSTTSASNGSYAYVIDFTTLAIGTIDAKSATASGAGPDNTYHARCVSGP